MKKIYVLILCAAFTFVSAACTSDNKSATANNTSSAENTATSTESNSSLTTGTEPVTTAEPELSQTEQTSENKEEPAPRLSETRTPDNAGITPNDRKAKSTEEFIRKPTVASNKVKTSEVSGQIRSLPAASEVHRLKKDELEIDMQTKLQFSAKTVEGKPVDSSIFKDYKLTMINVWGTLCKPCIAEMPDIQKLYEEMKEKNVNVIGFIANSEEDRQEKAQEILDAKGVTFMNVLFDDKLSGQISAQIAGYPTTIFVDGEGNVVGKQISGAKGKEEYQKEIESRLKGLQK